MIYKFFLDFLIKKTNSKPKITIKSNPAVLVMMFKEVVGASVDVDMDVVPFANAKAEETSDDNKI